jgi:hypothetical protein
MPKYVSELAQGNAFGRSSDNGAAADHATRKFKVLLTSPNESWDVFSAIGVNIGDLYSDANPIPCASVEAVHDGESRLVCIVTAEYRSSPGAGAGAPDPKSQEPTVRPALYSMTTSLTEIAAWGGAVVTGTSSGAWTPATNPVGDLVDGVTRLEPVVNINIEQYSYLDKTDMLGCTGYVNSDTFTFSGLTIAPHCCMLQSISTTPVVENFNGVTFRGFKVAFGFAVRAHWTITRNGFQPIGWDAAVPQTGFNIRNSGLGRSDVDQKALCLEHKNFKVELNGSGNPKSLATGTSNAKVRGSVTVAATGSEDGGYIQRPCAQPIALNDDGTPRNIDAFSPAQRVLINRVCLQPEMTFGSNFSNFGISVYSIT